MSAHDNVKVKIYALKTLPLDAESFTGENNGVHFS